VKEKIKKYGWMLVVFLHIMGLIFINSNPKYIYLTPYNLCITLGLIVFSFENLNGIKIILITIIAIAGFAIECFGVNTGLIFGNYVYGDVLGVKIMQTPILIAFNWVIVILSAFHITKIIVVNKIALIIISSLLCTLLDILIEPVAMHYNMWTWENNLVPLQNYIAWFICSLIFTTIYSLLENRNLKNNTTAAICFIVYVLFFSLL